MIKKSIKIIIGLCRVFLQESYKSIDVFSKNNKINKKSIYFWLFLAIIIALVYLSEKLIMFLIKYREPVIFLNIYLLILAILMIFQTILICINIFYFSKDLEFVLPFPIKPIELLIAKFSTLICILYITESVFGIIPIAMYGLLTNASILFFIYEFIILMLLPIFFALIICIIMMFFMQFSRFIKNKDLFQIIITLTAIIFIFLIEYRFIGGVITYNSEIQTAEKTEIFQIIEEFNQRIQAANKYFIIINPCVRILEKNNIYSFLQIIELLSINILLSFIFIFIGKITYIKNILWNTNYNINKKNKRNIEKKCKKKNIGKAYILKEFKVLFKNPMFFMQCVYPQLISLITITLMSIILSPKIHMLLQNEEFKQIIGNISFDINAVCIILGIMQVLFMLSTTSLTAISREGKNAIFMKYIPVSLYKQFIYKTIPSTFLNTIVIIVVLALIHFFIPNIEYIYIFALFILGMLINIINNNVLLIVDLLKPKLQWDSEYTVLKQNSNKIFQYVLTIIIILFLIYLSDILSKKELNIGILVMTIIFVIIIILINIFVNKYQKKLYKKII